jgi:hypothetical protein
MQNKFYYMCRYCNVRFTQYSSFVDGQLHLVDIINGKRKYPGMLTIHTCCDDQCGVADLIGMSIEEETE